MFSRGRLMCALVNSEKNTEDHQEHSSVNLVSGKIHFFRIIIYYFVAMNFNELNFFDSYIIRYIFTFK